jgi:hypothetical protein
VSGVLRNVVIGKPGVLACYWAEAERHRCHACNRTPLP